MSRTVPDGYKIFSNPPSDMAEHGLHHGANHAFFAALLDVIQLLRSEALLRECHPIHEKLVELSAFIQSEHCQDFVPDLYPVEIEG